MLLIVRLPIVRRFLTGTLYPRRQLPRSQLQLGTPALPGRVPDRVPRVELHTQPIVREYGQAYSEVEETEEAVVG